MARFWQYQARADVYPPTTAPAAAPNGWNTVAPDNTCRRQAHAGSYADTFQALPQPTAPGAGFEGIAPSHARRRTVDAGVYADTYRALPQPTAPGSGFESVAPTHDGVRRRKVTQEGFADFRQFFAPPVVSGTQAWNTFTDRAPFRRIDGGWSDVTFRALPQPAAPGSGFEGIAPTHARKKPTQAGHADFWLIPPMPPAPQGWLTLHTDRAPFRRVDAGLVNLPLLALAQPKTPDGWQAQAPVHPTNYRPRAMPAVWSWYPDASIVAPVPPPFRVIALAGTYTPAKSLTGSFTPNQTLTGS